MNTARLWMVPLVGLVAVCSPGLASERPQDDGLRESLERHFAAPAFDVVRQAERVDALPVETTGEGLSSTHRVVERPVRLDAATARDLRKIMLSPKSYVGGPMACMFDPGLALRFHKGSDSVQVLVCFFCKELVFETPGSGFEWQDKLTFSETVRARLLAVAKKALPGIVPLARDSAEPPDWPTEPTPPTLPLTRRGSSPAR